MLREEYDASEQPLIADLKQFLHQLQAKGLIEIYNNQPA